MRLVAHPNVVDLKAFFYSNGDKVSDCGYERSEADEQKDEVYLNLVLEFVPETVYRASRHYSKLKQSMPMLQVKLYMYQVSQTWKGNLVAVLTTASPFPRVHPFGRNLSPRHQTPKPTPQPGYRNPQVV